MPYASVDRFSINHYPKLLSQITKNTHKYMYKLQSCGPLSDAHMHTDVNIFLFQENCSHLSRDIFDLTFKDFLFACLIAQCGFEKPRILCMSFYFIAMHLFLSLPPFL